jgi:peptidoglycan/LPS O-acetylase OafA/YrhL
MMAHQLERSFGSATDYPMMIALAVAYLVMTFVASWLSYRFVEAPVLRWRDARYPEQAPPQS